MSEQQKPFKIKLHPPLDQATADRITKDTLEAIDDQLIKVSMLGAKDIGALIEGEGIYAGTWTSRELGKTFNVFAAPEDFITHDSTSSRISNMMKTFNDTVWGVSKLKQWHGHDGIRLDNEQHLTQTLDKNEYNGEWFIPTLGMLRANLFKNKKKKSLSGTFITKGSWGTEYWSLKENANGEHAALYFSSYGVKYDDNYYQRNFCRPVRIVPVK